MKITNNEIVVDVEALANIIYEYALDTINKDASTNALAERIAANLDKWMVEKK